MSKSLGNFKFTRDVLTRYHPETIRLFLLSNQYRSPIDFSDQNLNEAEAGLEKAYTLLNRLDEVLGSISKTGELSPGEYFDRFCRAMDDDFNTAKGIGILFDGIRSANKMMDEAQNRLSPEIASTLQNIRKDLLRMGTVLGILSESPEAFFKGKRSSALAETDIDESRIEALINQRAEARKAKDWDLADQVRDQLSEMGVAIEDRPDGAVWKIVRK